MPDRKGIFFTVMVALWCNLVLSSRGKGEGCTALYTDTTRFTCAADSCGVPFRSYTQFCVTYQVGLSNLHIVRTSCAIYMLDSQSHQEYIQDLYYVLLVPLKKLDSPT